MKPRLLVDLRVTRRVVHTRRITVTLRLTAFNLIGRRWAYNFGNPLSGTHFGPGRTVQLGLRVLFRSGRPSHAAEWLARERRWRQPGASASH